MQEGARLLTSTCSGACSGLCLVGSVWAAAAAACHRDYHAKYPQQPACPCVSRHGFNARLCHAQPADEEQIELATAFMEVRRGGLGEPAHKGWAPRQHLLETPSAPHRLLGLCTLST